MSNSHKDNWRELAEMLGLPVDEPAPVAPPPPPAPFPPATSVKPEPTAEEPTSDESPPLVEEFPVPERAIDIESTVAYEEVSIDDNDLDADMPPPEPVGGDEKPREEKRGRRRGRRGRRRGRDEGSEGATAPVAAETAEPNAAEAIVDLDDEREERPIRQRRAVHGDDVPAAATAVADDHNDEDDDFSQDAWADWNVPNWQELIDGLHRPDRDR